MAGSGSDYVFPSAPWSSDVVAAMPAQTVEIPEVVVHGGGAGAGAGGVADAWNRGDGSSSDMFWGTTNFDPVSSGGPTAGAINAHYYKGYWAGVQAELYGLQPHTNPFLSFGFAAPFSPFGAHSFGFATDVLQALQQPPTRDLNARVATAARALGSVSHPFEPWLTPESTQWSFGNNADEWPADLPDWGDRPSGPTLPGFSPIKGKMSDVSPFPQYLSPGQLQQYQDVNPELAPDANPDDFVPFIIETFSEATGQVSAPIGIGPFTGSADADITPGNVDSDVTPRGDWAD